MKHIKKVLSLLLVMAMLASMAVVVSAEEATAEVPADKVPNSITKEEDTGKGLAFLFKAAVSGATKDAAYMADYTHATVTMDGVEYPVVTVGAIMANQAEAIADIDNLTLADVDNNFVLNVQAKKLFEVEEASCTFAVRITNLPEQVLGRAIAGRPYIVLEKDGVQTTIYGDHDICTYNQVNYSKDNSPEETPVLTAGAPALDSKLAITAATAEYAAYDPATYVEAFKVKATLSNVSTNAKTSVGDTIVCTFKDADGNEIGTATLAVGEVQKGDTTDVEFYAPIGTATIEATELNLNYVPDIPLPAIGSDIDVTKKKNRIRVSATEASFNEDGTIHVSLTFKNYTSNWITEETDYVKYAYYKDGTRKGIGTIYIGVIDTKKNSVKTFEFDVPADTTEVRFASSKIVYWTEWA